MQTETSHISAREAAFNAIWESSNGSAFADEVLESWRSCQHPSAADMRLARQIAFGTIQMALSLDYVAQRLTATGTLKIKAKERMLLRSALYQAHFMERVPLYAIADETVRIAKKHCHRSFIPFLNAVLRSYATKKTALPAGDSPAAWSLRYSYPLWFVEKLIASYGTERAQNILQLGNTPAKVMARIRGSALAPPGASTILETPLCVIALAPTDSLSAFTESTDYYIQNATQVSLLGELSACTPSPAAVLDLCAAPGGKMLAAADLYREAKITANDVSEARLAILRDNIVKYHLDVAVTCHAGQEYPTEKKYDLVIIDAPCSNSGVLNKRPEARWRLSDDAMKQLVDLQLKLLTRASDLLAPGGSLWYLTCSILPEENEELMAIACQRLPLKTGAVMKTILPNIEGWDGGFACQLISNS